VIAGDASTSKGRCGVGSKVLALTDMVSAALPFIGTFENLKLGKLINWTIGINPRCKCFKVQPNHPQF
tara:strand:+ start:385 stop:588 length:204 start_codon:yes stop_codon:yes gene_type:complete